MIHCDNKPAPSHGGRRQGAGQKSAAERSTDAYARYNAARAEREEHNARIAEFEARKLAGELAEVAVMVGAFQRIAANVRAKALALPQKVAPELIGLESLPEVQEVLTVAVHEFLSELAGYGGD